MRARVFVIVLMLAGTAVALVVWLAPEKPSSVSRPLPSLEPTEVLTPARPPTGVNVPFAAPRPVNSLATPPSIETAGILADLENSDPAVRRAALQKARDLDDRAVLPRLREIAQQSTDTQERADMQDTINFLSLPSITEDMTAAKAARASTGQPDSAPSPTNRWTGRPFPNKH